MIAADSCFEGVGAVDECDEYDEYEGFAPDDSVGFCPDGGEVPIEDETTSYPGAGAAVVSSGNKTGTVVLDSTYIYICRRRDNRGRARKFRQLRVHWY